MGVNRLKVVIPNHEMNTLCARDCNPSLNIDRICDGSCFKICPLHCQIFSFPPIPPLIIHNPVTQTRTTTQTHSVSIIISITASLLVSASICILLYFLNKLRREERERLPPVFLGTQQDFIDEDQRPGVEHNPYWYINTVGLQQSVIDSIAVFKYTKDEMLIEGTDCSVCLGEFQEDDSLKLLPKCSHAFHSSCIDTWLRSHKNCPLCRAPIVSTNFGAREVSLVSTLSSSNEGEAESSEARNEGNLMERGDETKRANLENKLSISSVTRSESLDSRRPSFGSVSCGKLMKSASIGLVLEKGPISVKRSFSSTAKYPTYSLSMRHSESLPL